MTTTHHTKHGLSIGVEFDFFLTLKTCGKLTHEDCDVPLKPAAAKIAICFF